MINGDFTPAVTNHWLLSGYPYYRAFSAPTILQSTPLLPSDQELTALNRAPPVVSVSEVLSYSLPPKTAALFDSHLLSTVNCMPFYPKEKNQPLYQPFDEHQGTSRNALLVLHKQTQQLDYIMLDPWDTLQWEHFLKIDRDKGPSTSHDYFLCLHHADLGIYAEGAEPFPQEELKKEGSAYHALNAQAKFFGGEVDNYSPQEMTFLRTWISQKGVATLYQLFNEQILRWKDKSAANFADSPLEQLFVSLGIEKKKEADLSSKPMLR